MVVSQPCTRTAHANAVNLPVNTCALLIKCQKGGLMQQCFEVQVGAFADQFDVKSKRGVQGFIASEREHMKPMVYVGKGQAKTGWAGTREHPWLLKQRGHALEKGGPREKR